METLIFHALVAVDEPKLKMSCRSVLVEAVDGTCRYTESSDDDVMNESFTLCYCLITVLAGVVTADGGHLVDGSDGLERVRCADRFRVGLRDAERLEI